MPTLIQQKAVLGGWQILFSVSLHAAVSVVYKPGAIWHRPQQCSASSPLSQREQWFGCRRVLVSVFIWVPAASPCFEPAPHTCNPPPFFGRRRGSTFSIFLSGVMGVFDPRWFLAAALPRMNVPVAPSVEPASLHQGPTHMPEDTGHQVTACTVKARMVGLGVQSSQHPVLVLSPSERLWLCFLRWAGCLLLLVVCSAALLLK